MSRAEEIVKIQADLLDAFRTPDPDGRGVQFGVQMGDGSEFQVPLSRIGRAVDLVVFGRDRDPQQWQRRGLAGLDATANTVAPMVAEGLSAGRTYRIQENMTAPIVARADALPARTTRFGVEDGEIAPPRSAGFAWFEEMAPHIVDASVDEDTPGIGAISWNTVAGEMLDGLPVNILWVVVVWDDLARSPYWEAAALPGIGYSTAVPGLQLVPVTGFVIALGERLTGTPYPVQEMGDRLIRNPHHVVAALWQMLGETVPSAAGERAEQSGEDIDRRTQRRARRAGMLPRSEVTTVVLRRERRPVQHPGTGAPRDARVWVEPYKARRWVGSGENRRLVWRTIAGHWSVNNEELPVRRRRVVSELRR